MLVAIHLTSSEDSADGSPDNSGPSDVVFEACGDTIEIRLRRPDRTVIFARDELIKAMRILGTEDLER